MAFSTLLQLMAPPKCGCKESVKISAKRIEQSKMVLFIHGKHEFMSSTWKHTRNVDVYPLRCLGMLRIQNVTDVINRIAVGLCLRVEEVRWRDCCGSTRTRESLCCNCGNLVLRYLHVTGASMCHSVAFDSCKM